MNDKDDCIKAAGQIIISLGLPRAQRLNYSPVARLGDKNMPTARMNTIGSVV